MPIKHFSNDFSQPLPHPFYSIRFYFILRQMNYFTRNDITIKEYIGSWGAGNYVSMKNIKSLYCILPEHGLCDAWEWDFMLWFCYKAVLRNTSCSFIHFQVIERITEFNDKPIDSYQQQNQVKEVIVLCTLLLMTWMDTPRYIVTVNQWNFYYFLIK